MQPDEFLDVWLDNRRRIWSRIHTIVREQDAADDLTQELFVRVYQKLNRISETPIRYIMKAAGNLARSYVTSSYHRGTVGYEKDGQISADSPFRHVYRQELNHWYKQKVVPAVCELPEKYRHALDAYLGDDRPLHVARGEGIPMSTLLSRKKRALEILRQKLAVESQCHK